jgi:hypothetical protein
MVPAVRAALEVRVVPAETARLPHNKEVEKRHAGGILPACFQRHIGVEDATARTDEPHPYNFKMGLYRLGPRGPSEQGRMG